MSDDVDRSQERMEQEDQIRRIYTKRPVMEALPTGLCLNCSEELHEVGQRWCDSACCQDWELRRNRKQSLV